MDKDKKQSNLLLFSELESANYCIEKLIELFGEKVTNYAYTYVKDWGLAEDITQEVFIKVNVNLEQFRNDSKIETWIYSITANQSKDMLRKRYLKTTVLTDILGSYFTRNEKKDALEENVIQLDEDKQLAEWVLQLPIKYREVIILYYYNELTTAEIGELLDLNPSTVKSRLSRGRERLKKSIERGNGYGR